MGLELEYTKGQTPIDEHEKTGLKIKSISTMAELDVFEQQNIEEAIQWALKNSPPIDTILSETFINQVHRKMFQNVWKWAGSYRKSNKNIGVNYPLISQQLRVLVDDCKYWIDQEIFSPDEIAVRFKHGLVTIHLYPNGNGRHSRLMGDILIESFQHLPFTWGSHTIAKDQSIEQYIAGLRAADEGDFTALVEFSRR